MPVVPITILGIATTYNHKSHIRILANLVFKGLPCKRYIGQCQARHPSMLCRYPVRLDLAISRQESAQNWRDLLSLRLRKNLQCLALGKALLLGVVDRAKTFLAKHWQKSQHALRHGHRANSVPLKTPPPQTERAQRNYTETITHFHVSTLQTFDHCSSPRKRPHCDVGFATPTRKESICCCYPAPPGQNKFYGSAPRGYTTCACEVQTRNPNHTNCKRW